jgi:hypothetical protein
MQRLHCGPRAVIIVAQQLARTCLWKPAEVCYWRWPALPQQQRLTEVHPASDGCSARRERLPWLLPAQRRARLRATQSPYANLDRVR